MSSAPSGLDVREYLYGSFDLPLTLFGTYVISAAGEWLVTRARLFCAADQAGEFSGPNYGPQVQIAAGGCYEIEPNGAYRDAFRVSAGGGLFSAEFWFQARGTVGQSIQIYVTLPDFTVATYSRAFPR
jgi:hypothetical protein